MNKSDLSKASKANLMDAIATRANDPWFLNALMVLPNPDTVLRKLGKEYDVFDGIYYDAHVIGELRSVRASLLGFDWRLQPGGDAPADIRALELAQKVFADRPAPGMRWDDIIWNMAQSVFRGYAVHEVVWQRQDNLLVPEKIVDRPQRRFVFGRENELRLRTIKEAWAGQELGKYKWLLTRHMPSYDNPYGVALFSACFWPYTFKHSGYRFFVKFCEKYGIPKAVGRYPQGTPLQEQNQLADQLAQMIEDAVCAIPEGSTVELLETKHSGQLVHERLIDSCNAEMSKALTSQTLATEIRGGGSRAAAATHLERQEAVNSSDRAIIEASMNEQLAWMTELNFSGANPPRFEFYSEAQARRDWTEVFDVARGYLKIPVDFAHERLQIPQAKDSEEVLPTGAPTPIPSMGPKQFSAPSGDDFSAHEFADLQALDEAVAKITNGELQNQAEAMLKPLFTLIERDGPEAALGKLAELYPKLDTDALQEKLARIMFVADIWGRLNAD